MRRFLLGLTGFLLGINGVTALSLYQRGQSYTFVVVLMLLNVFTMYALMSKKGKLKK